MCDWLVWRWIKAMAYYRGSGSGRAWGSLDKADIRRMQQACNLLTDSKLVVDGVYGPATKAAVAHLQAKEE